MRIVRFWIDADAAPHAEEAEWVESAHGDERARVLAPEGPLEFPDGGVLPASPVLLAALSDTPVDLDQLSADRQALYELPLAEGARLVDRAGWLEASDAAAERGQKAEASVTAELAAQAEAEQAPRRAALEKLAEAAGLSVDETAALLEDR